MSGFSIAFALLVAALLVEWARIRPDIVILDHAMPRLSGCDAARAIRNRPETSRIKIVMNTATAEPDVRAIFSDYDAYHPKTADPERRLRTVNLLIGGGRSTARRA